MPAGSVNTRRAQLVGLEPIPVGGRDLRTVRWIPPCPPQPALLPVARRPLVRRHRRLPDPASRQRLPASLQQTVPRRKGAMPAVAKAGAVGTAALAFSRTRLRLCAYAVDAGTVGTAPPSSGTSARISLCTVS